MKSAVVIFGMLFGFAAHALLAENCDPASRTKRATIKCGSSTMDVYEYVGCTFLTSTPFELIYRNPSQVIPLNSRPFEAFSVGGFFRNPAGIEEYLDIRPAALVLGQAETGTLHEVRFSGGEPKFADTNCRLVR